MQLIDFFSKENYQITISCTADDYDVDRTHFEEIELVQIQLNHRSFDNFIKGLDPDVVLFDRFMAEEQFGWRVAEHAPNALRILDTEDLHSLRKSRETVLKKDVAWSQEVWKKYDLTKREIASIYRCDLALIISSFEMELLRSIIKDGESILLHLPFMLDFLDEPIVEKWKSYEECKDFVFIGFGGHAPNIDAIKYLKRDIWPSIRRKLPKVKLNIYGSNFPQQVDEMHDPKEGFLIKGWAKSAKLVIENARIMLAPLRFGAGLKGKLIDAMRYGTPSITTKIGAEGMHENPLWNGEVHDDPETIAEAAVRLYQDKVRWEQCRKNGVALVNTVYDKLTLGAMLSSKIRALHKDLETHRNKNFIGEMLQHQTMTSTKYMAKWIEEKNRN